jgi:hypothetical protein
VGDFEKDLAWSKRFASVFDEYYTGGHFKEFVHGAYLRTPPDLHFDVVRRDDSFYQQGINADVLVKMSNGNRLIIDEKVSRPKYAGSDVYPIETVSVTKPKKDGWGYKTGTTIVFARSNALENGFHGNPVIFTISERFINEVVRNGNYPTCSVPNKGYYTIIKLVPKRVLDTYKRG